ncbi:QueT transporter [uncultured archaeon]|nr:QueT transporter [uncultured archaeon]
MASDVKTILRAWTDRRQMRFILITAIIYAALLIPFKPFPIMLGFTEVRPANFVPALFGVLLGPAAAWGSAIGNLLADIASAAAMGGNGTLSLGSIFGFIGNFLYAYIAWKVWSLLIESEQESVDFHMLGVYCLAALAGSALCALVIGMGILAIDLQPFTEAMFMVMFITFNNFLPSAIIGSAALWLGYGTAKEYGWIYKAEKLRGK